MLFFYSFYFIVCSVYDVASGKISNRIYLLPFIKRNNSKPVNHIYGALLFLTFSFPLYYICILHNNIPSSYNILYKYFWNACICNIQWFFHFGKLCFGERYINTYTFSLSFSFFPILCFFLAVCFTSYTGFLNSQHRKWKSKRISKVCLMVLRSRNGKLRVCICIYQRL